MKIAKKILVLLIMVFVLACASKKEVIKTHPPELEITAADSVEYDLETFDTRFETWYEFQKNPSQYRQQSYYEIWNRQYVSAWNAKSISYKSGFFEPIIGYDPTVDYGFEINHELFYYFMYVERVLKIKIMSGGPRVPLL